MFHTKYAVGFVQSLATVNGKNLEFAPNFFSVEVKTPFSKFPIASNDWNADPLPYMEKNLI